MKRQSFLFALNSFGMFIVGIIIAVLINYYHYSWTGFLFNKAGLCDYKTVSVPAKNGFPQKLSYNFDLQFIAKEMLRNPNYEVNAYYRNRGVVITRKFGNINYQISFQNSSGSYEGFNLNTSTDDEKYSIPTVAGENCTIPNYELVNNIFNMIDDMPLSDSQKEEMKEYVNVSSSFRGKVW